MQNDMHMFRHSARRASRTGNLSQSNLSQSDLSQSNLLDSPGFYVVVGSLKWSRTDLFTLLFAIFNNRFHRFSLTFADF